MSLFSSILIAESELTALGYQRLGFSLGGVHNKTFWFNPEDGVVAVGYEVWGDPYQRYQVSIEAASDSLYRALYYIRRSEYPQWTPAQCEENALHWASLLGYAPERPELPHAA